MARRFFRKASRRARSWGRKVRRNSNSAINPLNVALAGAGYGVARAYLSQLIQPLTSKIPLGQYADEVVLGAAGYYLAKKQTGLLKSVGYAMLTIESAAIANQATAGMIGTSSSGGITLYG
jgi:hypothetical protein